MILEYGPPHKDLLVTVKTNIASCMQEQLKYFVRGTKGSYVKVCFFLSSPITHLPFSTITFERQTSRTNELPPPGPNNSMELVSKNNKSLTPYPQKILGSVWNLPVSMAPSPPRTVSTTAPKISTRLRKSTWEGTPHSGDTGWDSTRTWPTRSKRKPKSPSSPDSLVTASGPSSWGG